MGGRFDHDKAPTNQTGAFLFWWAARGRLRMLAPRSFVKRDEALSVVFILANVGPL
jgi:hypothetical protein